MNYIKKIIKSLFFILFPFALLSQNAKSNKDEILNYSTEDHRLHIKGQTFNTKGKVHDVRIRIVHDDGVIDTIISNNGKYNLHLELNLLSILLGQIYHCVNHRYCYSLMLKKQEDYGQMH